MEDPHPIRRMRESQENRNIHYQEKKDGDDQIELEMDALEESDGPYVEVVVKERPKILEETKEEKRRHLVRKSLRPPPKDSKTTPYQPRRKSRVQDDFELRLPSMEDETRDYTLEFVCMTPPHESEQRKGREKAKLRKSLRVFPLANVKRASRAYCANEEDYVPHSSFHQKVDLKLFESLSSLEDL